MSKSDPYRTAGLPYFAEALESAIGSGWRVDSVREPAGLIQLTLTKSSPPWQLRAYLMIDRDELAQRFRADRIKAFCWLVDSFRSALGQGELQRFPEPGTNCSTSGPHRF